MVEPAYSAFAAAAPGLESVIDCAYGVIAPAAMWLKPTSGRASET
jgi:hypothetical protein